MLVSGKETHGRDVHLLEKTISISTTSLSSKSSSSSGSGEIIYVIK